MKQLTLSQILGVLPSLDRKDISILRTALAELMVEHPTFPLGEALYEAVIEALGVRLPYAKFIQGALYKPWLTKCKTVSCFIEETFPTINKVAKTSLMRMLVSQLIDDLKSKQVTPSVRSVVLHLDTVQQQFDAMFPGYRENGLAHLVLDAMVGERGSLDVARELK